MNRQQPYIEELIKQEREHIKEAERIRTKINSLMYSNKYQVYQTNKEQKTLVDVIK